MIRIEITIKVLILENGCVHDDIILRCQCSEIYNVNENLQNMCIYRKSVFRPDITCYCYKYLAS